MNIVIFRTTLIYVLIVVAMRLMGKRQLGELQPSELVSTILISNLASISIEQPELPLVSSIIPVFIIVSLEIFVSALCIKSRKIEKLIAGSPRVVIKDGIIDQKMLNELRYTADDLLENLRAKDVFNIDDVEYAVVETNGSMSIYKKFMADTPTNKDLKSDATNDNGPSLPLILDGEIDKANSKYLNKSIEWIKKQCKLNNCEVKNVLFMCCDKGENALVIKKENDKSRSRKER